jgi:hypothetical protein
MVSLLNIEKFSWGLSRLLRGVANVMQRAVQRQ